jgi:ATP-binding cassette subfamily C (CFTR/MRP) protein 1
MGSVMIFTIGVLCVVGINGISPAQIGLALSYAALLTQTFGMIMR